MLLASSIVIYMFFFCYLIYFRDWHFYKLTSQHTDTFFFLLHWMQLMALTWCHAEQNLVKGFSLCCDPSLLLQFFIWKSVNCLLILASAICLSDCSLLLPDIALSGRHLRISLLPRCAANSKLFYSFFFKSSCWDHCDGWVINRRFSVEIENWSATVSWLSIYLFLPFEEYLL